MFPATGSTARRQSPAACREQGLDRGEIVERRDEVPPRSRPSRPASRKAQVATPDPARRAGHRLRGSSRRFDDRPAAVAARAAAPRSSRPRAVLTKRTISSDGNVAHALGRRPELGRRAVVVPRPQPRLRPPALRGGRGQYDGPGRTGRRAIAVHILQPGLLPRHEARHARPHCGTARPAVDATRQHPLRSRTTDAPTPASPGPTGGVGHPRASSRATARHLRMVVM